MAPPAPRRQLVLTPRTIVTTLAIALLFAAAVGFFYATRRVLVWIVIALVLALALDYIAAFFERWLPRTAASITAWVLALVALGGVGYLVVPLLVDQVRDFVNAVPDLLDKLSRSGGPLENVDLAERARRYLGTNGIGGAFGLTQPLLSLIQGVVAGVIGAVSVLFLTLFALISGPGWKQGLLGFLPERQRPLWETIATDVRRAVGGWVVGAFLVAVVAGVSSGVTLLLLGVPYAVALGVVVGLLDPIPFVGATLGGIVAALVTLATQGLVPALIFTGFFIAYQQFENHVLVPLVYGRTVELSAGAVLIVVLLGGELAGVVGAILAIPIAGAAKGVLLELWRWRQRRPIELPDSDQPLERQRVP